MRQPLQKKKDLWLFWSFTCQLIWDILCWCKRNCGFRPWILNHYNGSNTSLLIKVGTITIITFLPMRNKSVYSCSTKILALGFNKVLESILCILLIVEAFSPRIVVEMIEEVVVNWWKVRWMWQVNDQTFSQRALQHSRHYGFLL